MKDGRFSYFFLIQIILSTKLVESLTSPLPPGLSLHKVHLRSDSSSPWCFALTVDPTKEAPGVKYNFLATQVWPSARQASFVLEEYVDPTWTVCELGCGPALPSLVLAGLGLPRIIATDLDLLALSMVETAADEQGYHNLETKCVDLTGNVQILDEIHADLYVMSDVFENSIVAKGAAKMTLKALESGSKVWTFAQSDRAQRDVYVQELKRLGASKFGIIEWRMSDDRSIDLHNNQIALLDLDELTINYG